jgi:hypothetical protein
MLCEPQGEHSKIKDLPSSHFASLLYGWPQLSYISQPVNALLKWS